MSHSSRPDLFHSWTSRGWRLTPPIWRDRAGSYKLPPLLPAAGLPLCTWLLAAPVRSHPVLPYSAPAAPEALPHRTRCMGRSLQLPSMGDTVQGHRALAVQVAVGSLGTGQSPPTCFGLDPGSCRSPSAGRAGPTHGGPHPGCLLLRPEVGEDDVWACEVPIFVPVSPVHLDLHVFLDGSPDVDLL